MGVWRTPSSSHGSHGWTGRAEEPPDEGHPAESAGKQQRLRFVYRPGETGRRRSSCCGRAGRKEMTGRGDIERECGGDCKQQKVTRPPHSRTSWVGNKLLKSLLRPTLSSSSPSLLSSSLSPSLFCLSHHLSPLRLLPPSLLVLL